MKNKIALISAVIAVGVLGSCAKGGEQSSAEPAAVSAVSTQTAEPKEPELPLIEGFKGSTDKSGFKLAWKSCEGADGYELDVTFVKSGETQKHFISNELTEYVITDRPSGERAEFTLAAFKQQGSDKEYTARSKTVTLTTMQDKCILGVMNICQHSRPSLPTGCECTALAATLKYYGFDVTKNEIADMYLEKMPFYEKKKDPKKKDSETQLYGADPDKVFPGDPEDINSYGCYSTPIANAANRFLASQQSELKAKAVDGKKLSYWYKYVNNGTPIIIWATDGLKKSEEGDSWLTEDGKEITWLHNEHCLVLVGFDTEAGVVFCCDPLRRNTEPTRLSAKLFEKRYKEQGMHAVLIE